MNEKFKKMVSAAGRLGWELDTTDEPVLWGDPAEDEAYELSTVAWSDDRQNGFPLIIWIPKNGAAEYLTEKLLCEREEHDLLRSFLFFIAENTDLDCVYTESAKQSGKQAASMASMVRNAAAEIEKLKAALRKEGLLK